MLTRSPLSTLRAVGLALGSGLLIGAGQAPLGLWPATIIGVALLSWLLIGTSARKAFSYGAIAGLALNTLTVSWISVLGVAVGVALVLFLSLWWGLLGIVISRLLRLRFWLLAVPTAWVAMEYVSGKIPFGGFSWTRLGYTAIDQPLSGYFSLIGVAGVSLLVAALSQLLLVAAVSASQRRKAISAMLAIFLVGGLLNWLPVEQPTQQLTIAVVQPNVNREEHGTASYARSVTNNALSETIFALAQARSTASEPLDFIVWPENATDVDPLKDAETGRLIQRAVELAQVPIAVGAVTFGPGEDERQTTSIWWTPSSGPGQQYHKRNLVPFGEWIPYRDFLLPRLPILKQIGRQSIPGEGAGVLSAPVEKFEDLKLGTIICFELAYDETVYDLPKYGAEVVISQSNTNTYAHTFQPYQQLVINRVRAMELGREVVVSTLNSFSTLVDVHGRVTDPTPEVQAATRLVTVPLRRNVNLSVYLGVWIAQLACLGTLAGLALSFRVTRTESNRGQESSE